MVLLKMRLLVLLMAVLSTVAAEKPPKEQGPKQHDGYLFEAMFARWTGDKCSDTGKQMSKPTRIKANGKCQTWDGEDGFSSYVIGWGWYYGWDRLEHFGMSIGAVSFAGLIGVLM